MATEIKLPRLGQGMESGTIVKWLKSEGDKVEKGEPLYELDTDKVTQEVEADASGVLLKIAISSGEVEVGKTIAVIGEQGEEVAAEVEKPSGDGDGAQSVGEDAQEEGSSGRAREQDREQGRRASSELSEQVTEIRQASGDNGGRVKASPLARRIARERGIDLSAVAGTGPEGRVVAEDVERSAASAGPAQLTAPAATEGVEVQQLSSMRKTIARRLTEAWQAPVFQLGITVDMGRALELRKRLVELNAEGSVKPTISDLLTKVCAAALIRHRAVNALYKGDAVELYPTANIGIAVAVPNGLVVPVIPGCERKSIAEIAATRAAVVERARTGKLQQSDLDGGTFTISNLGMFGIERFVAVLNPPQAAILAVGSIEDRVVAVDGSPAVRPRMELTLTCDHRAIDGATGAEFLRDVKAFLEEPGLAL
ncbi:MAG TPA: dihydrolipoamide acetyltransferase family protein [Gaiellaceae bacterium]|nr:dihydrolipoamide acetyltransferase family protein [Gaiellaceae bacterium]